MAKLILLDGTVKGEVKLPAAFRVSYRPDLVQRAVLAFQSGRRQPYGTDPLGGKRTSAHYHGVKGRRYTMKNREMARGPRSHGTSPVQEFRMRFVPQSRGGRRAHPPKVEKVYAQKINEKEARLALVSAIAATASEELVRARGHKIDGLSLPIIAESGLEELKKLKDVKAFLERIKLKEELARAAKKKIRAGRGKMRGRKYRKRKSVVFIVSKDKGIGKAAKNLPGTDVVVVNALNVEMLAPGGQAGRLAVWSEGAVKKIGEMYG